VATLRPDVVARQVDVIPTERRQAAQALLIDGSPNPTSIVLSRHQAMFHAFQDATLFAFAWTGLLIGNKLVLALTGLPVR
jgi:hypothetical protein